MCRGASCLCAEETVIRLPRAPIGNICEAGLKVRLGQLKWQETEPIGEIKPRATAFLAAEFLCPPSSTVSSIWLLCVRCLPFRTVSN